MTEEIRLDRIVTGIDFHESAQDAALWVMRYFAPDAEHGLAHVTETPELPAPLRWLGSTREQLHHTTRSGAQRRLDEVAGMAPGARSVTHLLEGKPAAEIVRLAEETGADLIVVGEQGPTRGVRALLGSTAERVLLNSRIPVLVARKVGDAPPQRLVAAIDPAAVTDRILAWAHALLARFDATLTVLNVVDRRLLVDELSELPTARRFSQLEGEAVAAMREWLEGTITEAGLPRSRVEAKVLHGDPSYEIIAEAARQKADLVLIGTKGGDVARTPMIGRIVNRVVRDASCSVLVVTAAR